MLGDLPGLRFTGGVVASGVALVAVRRALAGGAPQAGVHRQAERAHDGDRGRDPSPAVFLAGLVGQVVDEPARDPLAEFGVVGCVEKERVPEPLLRPVSIVSEGNV